MRGWAEAGGAHRGSQGVRFLTDVAPPNTPTPNRRGPAHCTGGAATVLRPLRGSSPKFSRHFRAQILRALPRRDLTQTERAPGDPETQVKTLGQSQAEGMQRAGDLNSGLSWGTLSMGQGCQASAWSPSQPSLAAVMSLSYRSWYRRRSLSPATGLTRPSYHPSLYLRVQDQQGTASLQLLKCSPSFR